MSNREKYKQAFSALHISDEFSLEVNKMKNIRKTYKVRRLVALAACIAVLGTTALAYASDVGGIQRKVQLWMKGEQTNVTINIEPGHYELKYVDKDGKTSQMSGGGVVFDENGNERPLTEEELLEEINAPDVEYKEDGSVWVYYFDKKIEITDKFENDVCYVKLNNGKENLYLTIKYKKGYSSSKHKYPNPNNFNN